MKNRGYIDRFIDFIKANRWTPLILIAVSLMLYSIGRNAIHAIRIHHEIRGLEADRDRYQKLITRDSTFLESLKDEAELERFAREAHHLQRSNEEIFIFE